MTRRRIGRALLGATLLVALLAVSAVPAATAADAASAARTPRATLVFAFHPF